MTNSNCYIDRLPDDALRMIFESICEKDQATFHDYSMQNEVQKGRYWDDWHQDQGWYDESEKEFNGPPPSALIAAMRVCKRWRCLMSQIPTLWTVLQISFGDCAASLEKLVLALTLHILSHLVNLRIHYCTGGGNINTATTLHVLLQLLGALVNLQTLALELDMDPPEDIMSPIALPRLHYLAMKSRKMDCWIADFLHYVHMPNLRILTLDGVLDQLNVVEIQFEGILQELIRLTDKNSSSSLLELDELHLVNFAHRADLQLLRRLYKQMTSVKVLTLGLEALFGDDAFAMGLLPTSRGLADFPFLGLRTLIVFGIPRSFVRRIVLERLSLVGPLEELYYQEPDSRPVPEEEEEDIIVPDDWQHQVEKYHRIDYLESDRYCDVVSRQWSYLA
ncbi:hypothetical protein EV424DRAFT_1602353 [Suillus variegatus]|nr:hypothetical protein EV424DRAFT_1602353 [Suillus variegatus]